MSRLLGSVFLVFFSLLLVSSASAQSIQDAEIVEKQDRDGDGYVSEFKMEITADLRVDEGGNEYGDGVIPGKVELGGNAGYYVEPKGNPKFNIRLRSLSDTHRANVWASPPMEETESSTTFTASYDYDDVENLIQKKSGKNWVEGTEKLAEGKRIVTDLIVNYYESDSCSNCISPLDVEVDQKEFDIDNFRLEKPSDDREAEFSIESNADASVYVNGDYKGETPWRGQFPVDVWKTGLTDIRLEADGYETKTAVEQLSPPGSKTYSLEKVEKPLVVDSDPEGADVRVNGQKIGETPLSKDYWVNRELDVRVEGENETESYEDVTTPWSKTVQFGSSGSGSSYNLGSDVYLDPVYYDDLVTDLPDLSGLTVPEFAASKKKPSVEEEVEFNASESYSISYNITSYEWDMGDGTTRTGEAITHSYSSPGNYTVNLTVENSNGTTSSTVSSVLVENLEPKPVITLNGNNFEEASPVSFDASASNDPDGSIVQYSWDFGDSSTSSQQNPATTHVYTNAGTYTVELTVTDSNGETSKTQRKVIINEPNQNPSASFTFKPQNPGVNETITLDASASNDPDGSVQTHSWKLGNGLSKTGEKINYEYSAPGNYTIELIAIDSAGATASVQETVEVTEQLSGTQQNAGTGQTANPDTQNQTSSRQESSNQQNQQADQQEQTPEQEDQETEDEENTVELLIELIRSIF